jgi:hypothetical protein
MSRRKRAPGGRPGSEGAAGRKPAPDGLRTPEPAARRGSLAADAAILVAVLAATTAIAELAGAANLGVALGIGQIAFAIALVVVLLRA